MREGESTFDLVGLRAELDAAPFDSMIEPSCSAAYLAFYDLPETACRHDMWVVSTGSQRIVAQAFLPAAVQSHALVCHGYYDHVGLYGNLLRYLLSRGVAVVSYDQVGHGLSSGAQASIDSFDEYVEATSAVLASARRLALLPGDPEHWLGQSMGGAVLMEYLQQHEVTWVAGEVVLFAPLVRPHAWFINRWVFALSKRITTERRRTLRKNADNPEFQALQRRDPLQARVLPVRWVQAMVDWFERFERYPASRLAPKIVQGDADRTVSWRYNLEVMRRRYPDCSVLIIPQARHHLVNEAPQLRQQMWDWFDRECVWDRNQRENEVV